VSASTFQSREACESYFKTPGNFDVYSKLPGADGMLNVFKSLGWNVSRIPLPEPPKPITPMPVIPQAYSRDFGVASQPTVAEPVRESVVPSPIASVSERVDEAPTSQFKQIALRALARGEKRVLPIKIGGKNPLVTWAHLPIHNASTQEWEGLYKAWIDEKAAQFPDANACVVANADEYLFLDEDLSAEFRKGYEAFAGEPFPITYTMSARVNRCQSHWRQTDATRKLGNVAQSVTKDQMISVRQHQLYVLAEGSLHKNGVDIYKAVVDASIIPMPDKLVEYIQSLRTDKNKETGDFTKKPDDWLDAPFIHGGLDGQFVSIIGHYVNNKNINDPEELFTLMQARIEKNGCFDKDGVTPYSYNVDRLRELCQLKTKDWKTGEQQTKEALATALAESAKIASDALAAVNKPSGLINNMKPDGQAAAVTTIPEIDTSEGYIRPEFPYWAIQGTSIWDGLVAPALKTSSKHAEFIAMPAIQIMLNALSGNDVQVGFGNNNLNIFVGLISPYGQFFKSSSCALAMDYFRHMGKLFSPKGTKDTAEGRTAVIQAGSPEGFGLQAYKLNATRALLFNDELGKFVSKAGIEGSSFSSDLLTWHGAGEFGNNTSQAKNAFHFEAGKYTFGWLWATTDRGFNRHWPKLAGISSGLEDRMFFVVSPEKPKPTTPYSDPLFQDAATGTFKLIEKAITQKTFHFESPEWYAKKVSGMDPRSMDLVQKLCLYLCVDMGCSVIDDEHIDRALALVKYRNQAAAFLAPIEADNQQGRLQKEIIRELRQHKGKMSYRQLCRNLDFERYGLDVWKRAYYTMLPSGNDEGTICEWQEPTTPGKRATRTVGLVKYDDEPADKGPTS
jgi:hypothetical protein